MKAKSAIAQLLPQGAVRDIAKHLGLSPSTTSTAIRKGRPSHPAVREALRRIEESGVITIAEKLAALPRLPSVV
jgi:DNA-binding Lrp family transcriptional regulator